MCGVSVPLLQAVRQGPVRPESVLTDLATVPSVLVSGLTAAERDGLDRALQALLRAGRHGA
ncbi:hypothetical protein ACFWUT_27685 [Streptomyces cyaneofuscatus]|uniref:hypothetical protein n=1 Tax=Streptomyces cyaneofuscatus TaxID=66883 RepID=UPI003665CCCC